MRFLLPLSLAVSLLVTFIQAKAITYWVDGSCKSRPNWDDYLSEAFSMARKANERLGSDTDFDFAAVFSRLFKFQKADDPASVTKVRSESSKAPSTFQYKY